MTHDAMIQNQCDALMTAFPELREQTLVALNADGIVWRSLETGRVYYFKDGRAVVA